MSARHDPCEEPPPPALLVGIQQFNRGEFFECHETLEALWMAEPTPLRRLYQGILQVGVAFHHQRRGNARGALGLLAKGTAHLEPFAPRGLGVEVGELLEAARRCEATLRALGPERIYELDPALVPQIRLTDR